MLVARSPARAPRSLAWMNPAAKPVRACISSRISGKSTLGIRAAAAAWSATRLAGSSSLSRADSDSAAVPSAAVSIRTLAFPGSRAAVAR